MSNISGKKGLRIVSLLPAATDISFELGITLVGVTHECDHDDPSILRVTKDGLKENSSQGEIHQQIQSALLIRDNSYYPILEDLWNQANPDLVLTQDLCAVCGPSSSNVCELDKTNSILTISLSPNNLVDVVDTFLAVAEGCGVADRGYELQKKFGAQLGSVQTILANLPYTGAWVGSKPKVMLLEWLDPPFDGGHWIPDMIHCAGAESAMRKSETKSKEITWQQIYEATPDVVVVACCGFDLDRNRRDVLDFGLPHLKKLMPKTRIYVADGNQYFARPGPKLSGGVAILAQIAHPMAEAAIAALDFAPQKGQGWDQIDISEDMISTDMDAQCAVVDVEDLGLTAYSQIHREACERGDFQYRDPSSGYQVFTEVNLKARGKCCGSGCRHCPYNHENVNDKAALIKQPAFLHKAVDRTHPIKVLFFSGGKDSFLTIRALMRQADQSDIVLLTTFDAVSRIVAHQDISVRDIQRQAEHLDLSMVGIPLHRSSGISYNDRIQEGISLIEKTYGRDVDSLVFGDLHLEHIRSWREEHLGTLGYKLMFPLWLASYDELRDDLQKSRVPCTVSASTVDDIKVGTLFSTDFSLTLEQHGKIDGFGEKGEFHTLAQVWEVDREVALGLQP